MTPSTFRGAAIGLLAAFAGYAGIPSFAAAQAAANCPANLPLVQAGRLTMSINASTPPNQYIDKDGKLKGLHVDLGDELARRLCLQPDYINVAFEVQIPGLQSKRWDMIDTGLFYTPERAKIMRLVPYSINALALIAPAGNPLKLGSAQDLAGHVVGVELGGFEEKKIRQINDEQIAKGLKPIDLKVFNTYSDTFLALGAGQLDAVFAGDGVGKYFQTRGRFSMAVSGLYPGSPKAFAMIDPVLADAVVAAMDAMLADGTYANIMDATGATKIDAWTEWKGKFAAYYLP